MIRSLARALMASVGLLAACGPVSYVSQSRRASAEVAAARAAQAEKLAPYWMTLATEYLAKSREEAAQADFQAASWLGARAAAAAQRAIVEAHAATRRAPRPDPTVPAKGAPR